MLLHQISVELKRYFNTPNSLNLLVLTIVIIPTISVFLVIDGYYYQQPLDLFQKVISLIIPLLFPALVVAIYLPLFLQEQKNNFITYTRIRIPLETYIISKGIINALITGLSVFLMVFLTFIFTVYIEPNIGFVDYSSNTIITKHIQSDVTFTQLLIYGQFTYGFFYSLWVTLNAILYTSISYVLLLILKSKFIALAIPFLFYHIFNFILGLLGFERFSPISTIFPFNLQKQPIWTAFVPFTVLVIILLILIFIANTDREKWVE